MIRLFISITFFLVIGLLGYNYFLGTEQEKEQAQEIFAKGAEVVGASADLLKAEYEKFKEGKYDKSLENISNFLGNVKEKSSELVAEIENWEKRKDDWNQKKSDVERLLDSGSGFKDEEVKKTIKDLEIEGDSLKSEGKLLKERVN
ncbi:hypothetical protein [Nitrosomonas supralitoralis]|uniref:Uncharacterized protein n=1 Tax=Nitrosomonas supralitoralis TaxID=2116706 RepID=A0A2P7NRI4_9PROT|nr:hypothetical protein [Nitrosomonas supralitoralis]PSJ16070.1 hypothetical protein C7H79_15525 [Nitrosomonas supralitoralis]